MWPQQIFLRSVAEKKEEERKQKQKQKTTQAKFKSGTKKCGLESSESIKPVRRLLAAI